MSVINLSLVLVEVTDESSKYNSSELRENVNDRQLWA
jgi:hypothetical protein